MLGGVHKPEEGGHALWFIPSLTFPQGSTIWPHCETSTPGPSSCQLSSMQSIKWMHKKKVGGFGISLLPSFTPHCDWVQAAFRAQFKNRALGNVWLFLSAKDTTPPPWTHTFLALSPETTTYLPATHVEPIQVAQHDVRHTLHLRAIPPTPGPVFLYTI